MRTRSLAANEVQTSAQFESNSLSRLWGEGGERPGEGATTKAAAGSKHAGARCHRFFAPPFLGMVLIAGQALASNQPDREDFTRDFQKSLTVPTGQAVRLDHRQGNVTVRTHAQRELQLQASIRVSAPDKAGSDAVWKSNSDSRGPDRRRSFNSHAVSSGKQQPVLGPPERLILRELRSADASRFTANDQEQLWQC